MKFFSVIIIVVLSWTSVLAQDNDALPGQVAQEMVGKWCYLKPGAESLASITSSCITLSADGTYEMHVDRSSVPNVAMPGSTDYGTWTVSEGKIYYKSSSQGKGSMRFAKVNNTRLDNTPTIVIDGVVFCAASPRDPW